MFDRAQAEVGRSYRLKSSKLQKLLALIAISALASLGISSFLEHQDSEERSQVLSDIETPASSIIFTQRETLVYTTRLALWSNGGTTRRDVQIARNLLAQRLAVIDTSGQSMGERAQPAYWEAIRGSDRIVSAAPPGILPERLHPRTNSQLIPVIDEILAQARTLVVSYQRSVDQEFAKVAKKNAERGSRNLIFLYIFIFSGLAALTLMVRSNYRDFRTMQELLVEAERSVTKLKDLATAKNSLISNVNHELRTPLTSIIGYSDLIARENEEIKSSKLSDYVAVLQRNSEILLSLVESLLSLSRFDSGQGKLNLESVKISNLLEDALYLLTPVIDSKEMKIANLISENPLLLGDKSQLKQVFINLLGNAVKFSPTQSTITLSANRQHHELYGAVFSVTITDQGIGIASDELGRIFTRFFRASSAIEGNYPGSGLGLAIARETIQLHGGEIEIKSTVGVGSSVTVHLPLSNSLEDSGDYGD